MLEPCFRNAEYIKRVAVDQRSKIRQFVINTACIPGTEGKSVGFLATGCWGLLGGIGSR